MPTYENQPGVVTKDIAKGFIDNSSGLCDGYLLTADEVLVPVSKPVLAVRFPFFKRLFFDETENSEPQPFYRVSTTKRLLDHIIEFVYTNDCALLLKGRATILQYRENETIIDYLRPLVLEILDLMNASHYIEIAPLKRWCQRSLLSFTRYVPCTSCTILEGISRFQSVLKPTEEDPFEILSSSVVRAMARNPGESCLMSQGQRYGVPAGSERISRENSLLTVSDLGLFAIEKIVDQTDLKQRKAFEVLYCWASEGCILSENSEVPVPNSDKARQKWECAKRFVNRLALVHLSPSFLTKCVGPSRLVPDEQMARLYRSQLLRIAEKKAAKKDRKRKTRVKVEKDIGDDAENGKESSESSSERDNKSDSDSDSEDSSSESSSSSEGEESEPSRVSKRKRSKLKSPTSKRRRRESQ